MAFFSVEWNNLCNFGSRHHEKKFCEIILNLNQWFIEGIIRNNSVKSLNLD